MRVPIYTHRFFLQKSHCLLLGFLLGLMNSKTVVKVKKERKSIRETCPHFQCGTRQSLLFSWVHQISVLTQFCSTFFTVWHKFVPAFFVFGTVLYQLFSSILPFPVLFRSQFEFEKAVEFNIIFRKKN